MDDNCYVGLAGIDLSAAFDVVDVELLTHVQIFTQTWMTIF